MSNFTPNVNYTTEFDDDQVSMKLDRLKKKDIMKMAPHIQGVKGEDGKIVMSFEDQEQLLILTDQMLKKYVTNFNGLNDADGNPLSLDFILEEAYFVELTSEILGHLYVISNPTTGKEDDPKDNGEAGNLNGQPQDSLTD